LIGTDVYNRLDTDERALASQALQLADLTARVTALEQQKWGGTSQPFGGGPEGAYACNPSSAMAAASGPPPSGTPASLASQTIYQMVSGAWITLSGTATIYNGLISPVAITKTCYLAPDGAGNYAVLTQSCN
jgi:hypothetical protein